jgi:hypothetical protein
MARVIDFDTRERVITFAVVRQVGFGGIEDLDPGVQPVFMTITTVDQKIGLVANFHFKPFRKQFVEIIVGLADIGAEVTEVDTNFSHADGRGHG